MIYFIMGISFILIWLVTSFFIVRFVIITKNDILQKLSESQGEEKGETQSENDQYKPFDYINRVEPLHLLNFIQQEHPQVIALVLAHLDPDKASVILQNLPEEIQSDLIRRIATLDRTSPEIIREIERVLEKKLSSLSAEDYSTSGGLESVAEILKLIDNTSENQIIKTLEDEDPELAEAIKESMLKKPDKKTKQKKDDVCLFNSDKNLKENTFKERKVNILSENEKIILDSIAKELKIVLDKVIDEE